ncbi:MAG: flippase-like domain-containing protein [Phycisphaerae bacterium]|nr:flippase-like domain-containing protein [Gemmatimonadaceae bacterium]
MSAAPDSPAPRAQRTWWRVLQGVFIVAALAYFAVKISANWGEYQATAANIDPHWPRLALASVIVLGTYAILVQSWRVLIQGAGSRLAYLSAVRIWTIANLGRYIPGKVASIAALGVLAKQEGVSATAAASAAILGTLINVGAGFGIVSLAGSQVLSALSPWYSVVAWIGSGLFLLGVIALPWMLPRVAGVVARKLRNQHFDFQISGKSLFTSVTINTISWLSYGAAFMIFALAVLPELKGTLLQFVVVWAASYLVGYLAFFSPGGLGARELAMVAGLTALGMTDAAGAGIIAVTSRLWLSVLELLPGLIALLLAPVVRGHRPAGD